MNKLKKTDLKIPKEYEKYLLYFKKLIPEIGYCKQWLFRFPNSFGVSVVKYSTSYKYELDLFEIAMIVFPTRSDYLYHLYYCDITNNDVVGYLTNDMVIEYMERIKNYEKTKDN